MPITESAKKALRSSSNKRVFNLRRKADIDGVVKKIKKLVAEKKFDEAKALVPTAQKAIDKAVKSNYIKSNTGDRKKSRLVAFVKKSSVKA